MPRLALHSVVAVAATALVATLALVAPAQAGESVGDAGPQTSALTGAQPSTAPAETVTVEELPTGDFQITQLSTGKVFLIPGDPGAATPSNEHHLVDGCGLDWGRPYCDLTRAAQGLLIAGSLGTVAAAICGATGLIACSIAAGVAAAAAWYLIEYGRCSGNLRVRLNYNGSISAWCL